MILVKLFIFFIVQYTYNNFIIFFSHTEFIYYTDCSALF